jgi:hypothetical protein
MKALLVVPLVLLLIARAFVLMTLSLFLGCSSSCVNGTVTDRKCSRGDGRLPDCSCFRRCANGTDTVCMRNCVDIVVPVAGLVVVVPMVLLLTPRALVMMVMVLIAVMLQQWCCRPFR